MGVWSASLVSLQGVIGAQLADDEAREARMATSASVAISIGAPNSSSARGHECSGWSQGAMLGGKGIGRTEAAAATASAACAGEKSGTGAAVAAAAAAARRLFAL